MLTFMMALASAQTPFPDFVDGVIEPTSWYANGVQSPSMVWTGTRFVLAFSTPVRGACRGSSAIGLATSRDGFDWRVRQRPAVAPRGFAQQPLFATTRCGGSQPALVKDGDTWLLYFVEGDTVGLVTYENGFSETFHAVVSGVREPSVTKTRGVYMMAAETQDGGLWFAESADGRTWQEAGALPAGITSWSQDALISPSISCDPDPGSSMPYKAAFGGFTGAKWGITEAISNNGDMWFLTTAWYVGYDPQWTSWDAVWGDGEVAFVYEQSNGGPSRLGVAITGTLGTPQSRSCP